jgi:molecular chaperone GrpE
VGFVIEKEEKVSLSKEEYERLLKQAKELEEVREKLLRSAADYDNAKKRLAKEREEFIKFSQERLLRDLLPMLDNFERALQHAEGAERSSSPPPVIAGVQLIWKQLLDLLAAHGLRRFSSEGEPFDPHFHEAVEEVEEEGPEGIVTKEIVGGYLLHDRVLRPAKVRIRVTPAGDGKGRGRKTEEKEEEIT